MSPLYEDGEYVLSISKRFVRLKKGDVVIVQHPFYGLLIKEICKQTKEGYSIQGKNPASTASESFGLITPQMILGKVVMKIF